MGRGDTTFNYHHGDSRFVQLRNPAKLLTTFLIPYNFSFYENQI